MFALLDTYLNQKIEEFNKQNIKLKIIGNINILKYKLKKKLKRSENITKKKRDREIPIKNDPIDVDFDLL